MQVKEKFGGLRFYANGVNERGEILIARAEDDSLDICEDCGATENVSSGKGFWILTLCDDCRALRP